MPPAYPMIAFVALLAIPGMIPPSPPAHGGTLDDTIVAPPADHHVHVWSADARDLLVRGQRAVGQEVIAEEDARALTAADALAGMDSAGIRRGVLLSNAYFFGIPDVDVEDEYERVRAENDFVARQVARHPDRLVGFFSMNPLGDYAFDELERLADRDEFIGLKLHLGNSDVDLRDSADVGRLRDIFGRANDAGLAIVIHIGGRSSDFGARDAEAFLTEVLPAAPDVPVQMAHMAGPGGLGPGTEASLRTFAAAIERDPRGTRNLMFDLSGVPHPRSLAQGDSALLQRIDEINHAFLEAARAIGFDRVLFGSDFPAISIPRYLQGIRASLPLSDAEFIDLIDDPAPYLDQTPRVEVSWEPDYPMQGQLFRVVVHADRPDRVTGIQGRFADQPLHFHRADDAVFVALAAAPIDAEGELRMPVVAQWEGGARDSLSMAVPVKRGDYPMERLTVAPQYGSPPDSATLARMRRESRRARAVSRASHNTPRLWRGAVSHPRDTRITSPFGSGREFNGQVTSRHMGTDFAGDVGAPVRAAARGVVALVDTFHLGGNVIYIDHGAGLVTAYLHLSEQVVEEGDTVDVGQLIGRVGATGRVTGPHLHWIVRYGTVTVDPVSLLEAAGADRD